MKKFLLNIGLFVVVVAVLAVVCDYMISSGLRKTTIRKYAVWNDIYNGNNMDNDLVILGASSCWAHYNPAILDSILGINTYNLGIDGHPWFPCQPLRYNTYARYSRRPSLVLINIDMGTFNSPLPEPYEREQFFPFFWQDDSLISQVKDEKEISLMERYCPLWRYIGYREEIECGVSSFFGKKHFEDDGVYKGHRGNEYKWDRASLNTMDSITLNYDKSVIDSFIAFVRILQADGQNVILVKTPIYYELQERFTNRDNMCELYDSISAILDVPVMDYWNISIVQDRTYFCNSSHLNKRGADIFTTKLAWDLDSLLHRR